MLITLSSRIHIILSRGNEDGALIVIMQFCLCRVEDWVGVENTAPSLVWSIGITSKHDVVAICTH